jgi:pimeloyl-ACP methyl ester carboxylesterase
MSDEIVTFGGTRSLVGILHRPDAVRNDLPCVLLLNAGILHRVGPNRLYVRIARRLERLGFPVLRFDVWGIGDSQDHTGIRENKTFFDDTLEAMDMMHQRTGVNRFMLMGICMGAKIALEVAGRDRRVDSLVLMEGIYVKSARYYISRLLNPTKWKRLLSGESHMVKQIRKRILHVGGSRPEKPNAVARPATGSSNPPQLLGNDVEKNMRGTLQALLARGAKILLLFRDGNEIAYNYRLRREGDAITAVGLPHGLEVEFVRFADHTFTPLVSQELLLDVTMKWIEETHLIGKELPIAM